jgi:hypothetical protein
MLSLESVLGFCHGIAKGGDCKVEFIQPSNWLYSVPNLLVIQHLVTLYLGGFDVRVVSEIEWSLLKSVQENRVSRLGLAGDSRLQAARSNLTCQACWKVNSLLAGALQDKTGQLAIRLSRDWISRLSQAARSSREPPLFCRKPDVSHSSPLQYKYPYYPRLKESFQREFWERNPKEKLDWFTHNLYLRDSSNSSTLFLSIVKSLRGIIPNQVLTIIIIVRLLFGFLGSS